jgi:transcriptional regulator with XRE-family HTH domain
MKKYATLGELVTDYRNYNKLSQSELAAMLDVDGKTVGRWERSESLVNPEKEKDFVEKLSIPYQVIRNLNSEYPLVVYYDIRNRTYSLEAMTKKISSALWFKSDFPVEDDRIRFISRESDAEFIADIQKMRSRIKPVRTNMIRECANLLPELNLVLHDQSGFYAGHITVFPLKQASYFRIKNRETNELSIDITDLSGNPDGEDLIFYFYSMYADSMANAYYLMNRLLSYFKEKQFKNYVFAGVTYRNIQIQLFREMGLKIIWQDKPAEGQEAGATLMEGNFDMFLFGKMG